MQEPSHNVMTKEVLMTTQDKVVVHCLSAKHKILFPIISLFRKFIVHHIKQGEKRFIFSRAIKTMEQNTDSKPEGKVWGCFVNCFIPHTTENLLHKHNIYTMWHWVRNPLEHPFCAEQIQIRMYKNCTCCLKEVSLDSDVP